MDDSANKNKKRILIQKIQDLPTLPTTITKIIHVSEEESSTASDLAAIISKDQSISSTVLKLVNSAFYGHLRQVSSISHAIVILGFQTVKALSLGVSIFRSTPSSGKPAFDRNLFWIHSIGVATFTKQLAERPSVASGLNNESVFLAGLLHDIGKVVFDNYFTDEYQAVAQKAITDKRWIGEVELSDLGIDHSEAGRYLAQKWQFPREVIESIGCHHSISTCAGDQVIPAMVHVADYCCRKMKLGSGGDNAEIELDPEAVSICGVNEEIINELIVKMEDEREMIEAFAFK